MCDVLQRIVKWCFWGKVLEKTNSRSVSLSCWRRHAISDKEIVEEKDGVGAVYEQIFDCESRPVFGGLLQARDLKNVSTYTTTKTDSVCRVNVNMGQSVLWSVNVSALSSCHRFMLFRRTLFSSSNCRKSTLSRKFFRSTYLKTHAAERRDGEDVEIMVKEIKHMQTSTWREWQWHKHWVLLFLVSVWVQWPNMLNIIFYILSWNEAQQQWVGTVGCW